MPPPGILLPLGVAVAALSGLFIILHLNKRHDKASDRHGDGAAHERVEDDEEGARPGVDDKEQVEGKGGEDARKPRYTVFVTNVPRRSSKRFIKRQIMEAARPFRPSYVKVAMEGKYWNKGFAHIIFKNPEGGPRCIAALHGCIEVDGHLLGLSPVTDKRDLLFCDLPYEQREAIRLDGVAEYSVTEASAAKEIAALMATVLEAGGCPPEDAVVVDGTACAGGCVMALARVFGRTHAVELDRTRFEHMEHNLGVVGLRDRVTTHHGDFCCVSRGLEVDAVLMDPPWGGCAYSKGQAPIEDLRMGARSFVELCVELRDARRCQVLALRLPHNFDLDSLKDSLVDTSTLPEKWPVTEVDPHPFVYRLRFGDRGAMLLMCLSTQPRRAGGARYGIRLNVDRVIRAVSEWDKAHGNHHQASFWDWDKKRWIKTAKWLGVDAGKNGRAVEQ